MHYEFCILSLALGNGFYMSHNITNSLLKVNSQFTSFFLKQINKTLCCLSSDHSLSAMALRCSSIWVFVSTLNLGSFLDTTPISISLDLKSEANTDDRHVIAN